MTSTIGIPIKLLNEAQGHVVTLEITSGQVYRGKLLEAEDNMNVQLKDITVTARDGRVSHLDQVYIRGSHVRFFIVPDMLRNAPMFRSRGVKGRGVGLARGRATVSRARASGRGAPRGLTGTAPTPSSDNSIAGVTHTWAVTTPYYHARIPIWLDEIVEPAVWKGEFLAPEAREVLTAIGAVVVCVRKPVTAAHWHDIQALLAAVGEVVKDGCGYAWDGVVLAVAMPQSLTPALAKTPEEWEDACQDAGFEFVDFEAAGRNEFSEPMGLERLKEALEANEWEGGDDFRDDINFDDFDDADDDMNDDDEITSGFGINAAEMEVEMAGMKQAIYGNGQDGGEEGEQDDEDVEKLQAMMQKMQAVRDLGADLPEAERRKLAAKTVNEVMKTL
ncbi:LSM domain-containing protein [Phlyctema vagabunda]